MSQQIQLRRDIANNWLSNNPILAEGEIGIETDTVQIKIGDGTTAWVSLPYHIASNAQKAIWDAKQDELGSTPEFNDVSLTGLTGSIITTESLKTSIQELDDSLASTADTGFGAWTSGNDVNTYTIVDGKFQIDRSGYGYINGKKVTWASGLQTEVLEANNAYFVHIHADGTLHVGTSFESNTIRLFIVLYDGTTYLVTKENHHKSFDSAISGYLHQTINVIIRGTGANITRVTTGTGVDVTDRQIKIVGADVLDDHGLSTTIPDSAGAGVIFHVFYRNASGKWICYGTETELPIKYNNAGTPTDLDITNQFSNYVLYVMQDDIETSTPQYLAVMGETVYTDVSDARLAITNGENIFTSNELHVVESAQLGYAIVQYSATGGYVEELQIAKSTFNQQFVGGGGGASSNHGLLTSLDYASSGHIGFQASLGFTPEDVANKDTDNTLAADSDTKYASQKAVKSYIDTGLATKQASLGFTAENVANKDIDNTLSTNSDTKYPSQKAVKSYVDTGLATKQASLGFTPENITNKDTDGTLTANSDTKYPSQKATKTYADTKLAKSGGTLTGDVTFGGNQAISPKIKAYTEAQSSSSITGATNVDLSVDNVKIYTLTGNVTFTFTNVPTTGQLAQVTLFLTQGSGGSKTITWPGSIKWAGGTAPTISTVEAKTDIVSFVSPNGGTNWYGFVGGIGF